VSSPAQEVEGTSGENQPADNDPSDTERVGGQPPVPAGSAQADVSQQTESGGAGPDSREGESPANADMTQSSDDTPAGPDRTEPGQIETLSPQSTKTGSSPSELLEIWRKQGQSHPAQPSQSAATAPFVAPSPTTFPLRAARSADRLAERSMFLRPVRTRFYRLATSLSRTIVELGAPPSVENPGTDVERP
jgi:hypothetical protein